jgi:TonB family protein
MSFDYSPDRSAFGLLPEPERSPASFFASACVNGLLVVAMILIGTFARRVMVEHRYEDTVLIMPMMPTPRPRVKMPEPPKIAAPKPAPIKLQPPRLELPKPIPAPKPIRLESKLDLPVIKAPKPEVVLAPQPKAAMPSQSAAIKPSVAPVHLGDTFGVTPNPNANRPATVAAIGNPYGGLQGPSAAPHGVVGSTGFGNGLQAGSNFAGGGGHSGSGRVASAGLPTAVATLPISTTPSSPTSSSLEILSKPPVQYTNEARQLKIQGDVVLRVTFTAAGQVVVHGVLRGLGYGLDEEAERVAHLIRFHPATRNGQPTDLVTNITITFQLT